ncbi:hypothetical protein [Nitrincola sp. MINF-07-Sa-05]|uniref:hypothetical protein n=1 Tax=Nitrincola salilacus TaxID=3400273 RepID=UPI003917FA33
MVLLVGSTPYSDVKPLVPFFEWLGSTSVQLLESSQQAEELEQQLKSNTQAGAILLFHSLEYTLHQAVTGQDSAEGVVERWRLAAEQMLRLSKLYRGRVFLFDLDEVLSYPQMFFDLCVDKFSVTSEVPTGCKVLPQFNPAPASLTLAVAQLKKTQMPLFRLSEQLKACAYPVNISEVKAESSDPLAAFNEYRQLLLQAQALSASQADTEAKLSDRDNELLLQTQRNQQLATDLEQREEESSLLIKQLHTVQEELERAYLDKESLEEENSLLINQLHTVQEEFEQIFLDRKSLQDECSHLQQAVTDLNADLNARVSELEGNLQQQGKANDQLKRHLAASELRIQLLNHQLSEQKRLSGLNRIERSLLKKKQLAKAEEINQCEWFDAQWYLDQYPDIASDQRLSSNPALHYLRFGAFEGRNPSVRFNSFNYLLANPDVLESGMNPLWHFIKQGLDEGRKPL